MIDIACSYLTWLQDGSLAGGDGRTIPTELTLKPMDWLRLPEIAA